MAEESAGAVPVIAGVGFNTAIGRQLAADAARAGADGILAFPPYYPQADDEGLLAYYRTIAAATPLGMLIYSRDWFHPGAALVERLAGIETLDRVERRTGRHTAAADPDEPRRRSPPLDRRGGGRHGAGLLRGRPARLHVQRLERVAPPGARPARLRVGGDPRLRAIMSELIVPLYALRGRRRGYEVSVMKAMMDMMGLAGGPVRPPLTDVDAETAEALRGLVAKYQAWHGNGDTARQFPTPKR